MSNQTILSYVGFATLLAILVVLFSSVIGHEDFVVRPERVDLALRQIGHELLGEMGDSSSQIPAVRHREDGNYLLPLNRSLDYGTLQRIGPEVMTRIGLHKHYSLALVAEGTDEIILGFDWINLGSPGEPACTGRNQTEGCHDILLSIHPPAPDRRAPTIMAGSLLLLILGSWLWHKKKEIPLNEEVATESSTAIRLSSQTDFDPIGQQLNIGGHSSELTFRESKLLQYLAEHQGEVLSRENIHAAVWGSEGVLVGRSLDVFISRLRKKLAKDEGVEIATIHGVGYRFLAGK